MIKINLSNGKMINDIVKFGDLSMVYTSNADCETECNKTLKFISNKEIKLVKLDSIKSVEIDDKVINIDDNICGTLRKALQEQVDKIVTLQFIVDDNVIHEVHVVKNATIAVPENIVPEKQYYEFVGWEPELPESVPDDSDNVLKFIAKYDLPKELVIEMTVRNSHDTSLNHLNTNKTQAELVESSNVGVRLATVFDGENKVMLNKAVSVDSPISSGTWTCTITSANFDVTDFKWTDYVEDIKNDAKVGNNYNVSERQPYLSEIGNVWCVYPTASVTNFGSSKITGISYTMGLKFVIDRETKTITKVHMLNCSSGYNIY